MRGDERCGATGIRTAMKLITNPITACTTAYRGMLECEFAAPVLRGRPVIVALEGGCRRVQMLPPAFQGWAVARLIAPSMAVLMREAEESERQALLDQWSQVTLQLWHVDSTGVLGVSMSDAMSAVPVRVHLCDETVSVGDIILARFDGRQHWFDRIITRPRDAARLEVLPVSTVLPDLCAMTYATRANFLDEPLH